MEESLFGFGGFLLEKLSVPMTVDELWKDYKRIMTVMGMR